MPTIATGRMERMADRKIYRTKLRVGRQGLWASTSPSGKHFCPDALPQLSASDQICVRIKVTIMTGKKKPLKPQPDEDQPRLRLRGPRPKSHRSKNRRRAIVENEKLWFSQPEGKRRPFPFSKCSSSIYVSVPISGSHSALPDIAWQTAGAVVDS